VIARRVIARRLFDSLSTSNLTLAKDAVVAESPLRRIEDRDQVERLMARLEPQESNVVRLYHLEGKSYEEISRLVGMSENSIGPLLSRARQKMREGA
jgi:RNA polymerase sigma-70 factor (ECF subfamily)